MSMLSPTRLIYVCILTDRKAVALTLPSPQGEACQEDTSWPATCVQLTQMLQSNRCYATEPSDCRRRENNWIVPRLTTRHDLFTTCNLGGRWASGPGSVVYI
jgi:hypothetical protein